mgnify:CR=1 FL=1
MPAPAELKARAAAAVEAARPEILELSARIHANPEEAKRGLGENDRSYLQGGDHQQEQHVAGQAGGGDADRMPSALALAQQRALELLSSDQARRES